VVGPERQDLHDPAARGGVAEVRGVVRHLPVVPVQGPKSGEQAHTRAQRAGGQAGIQPWAPRGPARGLPWRFGVE